MAGEGKALSGCTSCHRLTCHIYWIGWTRHWRALMEVRKDLKKNHAHVHVHYMCKILLFIIISEALYINWVEFYFDDWLFEIKCIYVLCNFVLSCHNWYFPLISVTLHITDCLFLSLSLSLCTESAPKLTKERPSSLHLSLQDQVRPLFYLMPAYLYNTHLYMYLVCSL